MAAKTSDHTSTGFSDFRTIRVPCLSVPMPAPKDAWVAMSRSLAARRGAVECRDLLARFLTEAGYCFQTYLEEDDNCVWRVHFSGGKDALAYLEQIAGWTCGPGDPLSFDPSEWLAGRSQHTP